MPIRKFRASRVNSITANEFVGQQGDVFYDESTGQFRVSNGVSPGGVIVSTALNLANGTADIFVNNITVNGTNTTINNIVSNNETTVTGVLTVTGNASFVGNTEFTGPITILGTIYQIGDRITSGTSTFTGNSAFTGNSVFSGNTEFIGPSIFNGLMTITGDTSVVGNVSLTGNSYITGNTFVTGPTTVTGNAIIKGNAILTGNSYINGNTFVTGPTTVTGVVTITGNSLQTGLARYVITSTSSTLGGVEITGNTSGLSQTPVNQGVMLHVTGQENINSRIYNDSSNNYAGFVGRRYNGNMLTPSPVLADEEITRFAANPYTSGGWLTTGVGQLRWYASETQTATSQGGRAEFWVCPIGSNTTVKSVTIDSTGITVAGNVVANTVGTLTGNVNGTIITAYQPNITSVGTLANLTVDGANNGTGLTIQGNLRYDINYGNATATQLTDKSVTVTCNGRTGQITTSNSSIAKGAAVTFTVNNSYITSVTDLPIVAIQSGAAPNSYAIAVTRVQVGSFNITITNNGTGPLTDTIVINFGVMKIG